MVVVDANVLVYAVDQASAHHEPLRGFLRDTGTAGNLTTDAHLAALAIEHGADIVSYDRDFARFPGVKHRLPGSAPSARS